MVHLQGRTVEKTVETIKGKTLLDLAYKNDVDWGFSCWRGTCGRCQCVVESGMENLSSRNDAEHFALSPEERGSGYRLACQARLREDGDVRAAWKPD